jgi:uncharacterized protein YkwD
VTSHYRRIALGVLIGFLPALPAGCGGSTGGGGNGNEAVIVIPDNNHGSTGCSGGVTTQELAAQVVALANNERAAAGLAALTVNPTLQAVAEAYAEQMVTQGFIGHTDPAGNSVDDRVTAAGYTWIAVGENLAYGPCTAEDAIDGWMNSEGHRANILNAVFTETGVGAYPGSDYPMYWVHVFATPL